MLTSLPLRSKPLHQKLQETVDFLRVNEAKITSRNAFNHTVSALKKVKQSEKEESSFGTPQKVLNYLPTVIFLDNFGYSQFLATSCSFWNRRLK